MSLGKHALAMELADEFSAGELSDLFKFAFVRNPYDWLFSWYKFRQRDELSDPEHCHHNRYAGGQSFDEFMLSYNKNQIFMKQSDFLYSHQGEKLVDYVGRYERVQKDFEQVCQRLHIPLESLPQINVSKGSGSVVGQMSAATRNIINQTFRRDFELFGYEMLH